MLAIMLVGFNRYFLHKTVSAKTPYYAAVALRVLPVCPTVRLSCRSS